MPLPDEGPCQPWCTWAQVEACVPYDLSSISDGAVQADIIAQASEIIFNLNHQRYPGVCEATRGICQSVIWGWFTYPWWPYTHCGPGEAVDLGSRFAVEAVSQVIVNGVILPHDGTVYRVDGWRYLTRIDGNSWPRCADLTDPLAFQATWTWGRAIPKAAQRAAARFAAELAAECIPDQDCQIPKHVTTVSREGMTFVAVDSFKMLEEGRTGIYAVDSWLAADLMGSQAPPGGIDPAEPTRLMALGTDH